MTPRDPQEDLDRGHSARALLSDSTFLSVLDDLSTHHLAAIVAAPPGPRGVEARDYHHLLHYALSEIAADLQGRIAIAVRIEQAIQQHNQTDEDDAE